MLSSREREALAAIEAAVSVEDPVFADLMAGRRAPARPGRRAALVLFLVGMLGVLLGMTALSGLTVAVSVVAALVGGGLWLWLSGAVTPGR